MFAKNIHLLSTQRYLQGGASVGAYANFNLATYTEDEQSAVAKNRALLQQHFELPSSPKWLNQTHSAICVDATSANNDCADASISNKKGVVCAILTADCLPIFAANKAGTKIGIAHAGWQGILKGVIESFVKQFDESTLLVHFGAAISQSYLTLDNAVYQQFIDKNPELSKAFKSANKQYYLDVYYAARIILNGLGVSKITGGESCTYAQPQQYFSYRRDGAKSGRMAHLIWMS